MKKALILTLLAAFLTSLCSAQSGEFRDDLEKLYETLQKTPSFKDQIKGQKRKEYDHLFEHLKNEPIKSNPFDSLFKLSQLLWPVKDNHLGLYQLPDKKSVASKSDTGNTIKSANVPRIKRYPVVTADLDSLEKQLLAKPVSDVEGIYYNSDQFRIGVYQTAVKDSLVGVVLYSSLPIWNRGEVAVILKNTSQNNYRGIYANLYNKDLFFVKNDRYANGRFLFGSKKGKQLTFSDLYNRPDFELKVISSGIKYLRLGNFGTSNTAISKSSAFYNQIKDSLDSENLIVDLRNNPGGGFKASGKFLSLLKTYSKKGKLYLITNYRTFSNAEQFVLALKGNKNVVTLGQTTNGTITYGNNYGKSVTLSSGKYRIYITDMNGNSKHLAYEESGISPDVELDQNSDWVQQVVQMINKQQP
jgi:hypothetical protein